MMRTFINCFGPYPFPAYTVVVAGDVLEIPLEAQGMSILGPNHLERTGTRSAWWPMSCRTSGSAILTAASWQDIWLHEGFACYAEWIWSEEAGVMGVADRAAAAWRRLNADAQDLLVGDPGPEHMSDDRVTSAARWPCTRSGGLRRPAFFALLQEWATPPARIGGHRRLHPGRGPGRRARFGGAAPPVALRGDSCRRCQGADGSGRLFRCLA